MSFTCSWVLVKGSLENVFDPGAPQRAAHAPAVFAPPLGVAQPGPCEFTLELDEAVSARTACRAPPTSHRIDVTGTTCARMYHILYWVRYS